MSAPELRFKCFAKSKSWGNSTLGELVSFSKGGSLSKNDLENNGVKPCVLYGELYTNYTEIARKIISSTNSENTIDSVKFDVVLPTSGETAEDIARSTCILNSGVAYGGDLLVLRSKVLDGRFLSYQISAVLRKSISRVAQGKTVVHINSNRIENIKVNYPEKDEQERIASFFMKLDEKIAIENRKFIELEKLKAGLMQKIFSRELRFNREDGLDFPEWHKAGFLDMVETIQTGKSKKKDSGRYVLYGATGEIGLSDDLFCDGEYILAARVGSVGVVNIREGTFAVSDNTFVIKNNSKFDIRYLFDLLSILNWKNISSGTSQPVVAASWLKALTFSVCSLEEQKKICDFLELIGKKIDLCKMKTDNLLKLKKAFMQKMFI